MSYRFPGASVNLTLWALACWDVPSISRRAGVESEGRFIVNEVCVDSERSCLKVAMSRRTEMSPCGEHGLDSDRCFAVVR